MSRRSAFFAICAVFALLFGSVGARADEGGPNGPASALGAGFTYQGQIQSGGQPVSANCDMGFRLYAAGTGGLPVASVISLTVPVTASLFTVGLDFGAGAFDGSARWLDLTVRCPAGSGAFATLSPRQALTAAPYALVALSTGALQGQPVAAGLPANGQVLKWNGTAWTPGTDNTGGGGGGWLTTGNAGTSPANFLGTTDNMTLTLAVSGTVVMRYGPNATSPNIVGGYSGNVVSPTIAGAVIAGGGSLGATNVVSASFGTISGGEHNFADDHAVVGGGLANNASGQYNTIGGGVGNTANGQHSTVAGGYTNQALSDGASVGGGDGNVASGALATVAGGGSNQATAYGATVSGGGSSTASGLYATVGGGWDGSTYQGNQALAKASTIGGGLGNVISVTASYGTVGGGSGNEARGVHSTVGGGYLNIATNGAATVGGGISNQATGNNATVGGGVGNQATGSFAAVGGGYGNTAAGSFATLPGGYNNSADGNYSFAGGQNAHALHNGSFVWADFNGTSFSSTTANQFLIRAGGGVTLYTDSSASVGATLPAGSGSWSIVSDRNLKANFASVDDLQLLEALAGIPIQTWNYKTQDTDIRHLGPMAQDFHAAFGVGENDTTISTVDAQGVALAGVQGLYHLAQDQAAQLKTHQAQIDDLQARLSKVEGQPIAPQSPLAPPTAQQLPLGWLFFGGLLLLNLGGLLGYLLARGRRPAGGAA